MRRYTSSDEWLEGLTGSRALAEIDDAEFHISQLLEELGDAGRSFRESEVYSTGMAYLQNLRQRHETLAQAEPIVAVGVPAAQVVETVANPLGNTGKLLSLITDEVVKNPRNYSVLLSGLRGASMKAEDETPWKEAALGLYNRHTACNPTVTSALLKNVGAPAMTGAWTNMSWATARISNEAGFMTFCRASSFRL